MSWDIGYQGTCNECGLSIHAAYEDRPRSTGHFAACGKCFTTDGFALPDGEKFVAKKHTCYSCRSPMQEWDMNKCPRCDAAIDLKSAASAN